MSEKTWLQRLVSPFVGGEKKSYITETLDTLTRGATTSGIHVNSDSAMQITTVYACVRVIAESVAQLPVHVMKRDKGGTTREKDFDHQLYRLWAVRPNSWQTPFEFKEMLMAHVLLRGNAYAYKVRAGDGRVLELIPIHPDVVQVTQASDYTLMYQIKLADGGYRTAKQDEIFHLRGLGTNGITGLNPIAMHREAVGLTKATERHGAAMFGNGAKVGGVLKHPNKLSPDAQKRLKESWGGAMTGENAYSTAILEEGMEWIQMGMTSEDSQYLETRKFQRSEIASIFRVPPHKIGDLERATFSNIEHQSLGFVQDTLLPWVRRIEEAILRDLMPLRNINTHYVRFNVDSLLRGDIKTRFEAYATGIQWGILSPNEARELEDRNPRDNGDEYLSPLNMIPSSQLGKEPAADPTPAEPSEDEKSRIAFRSNVVAMLGTSERE